MRGKDRGKAERLKSAGGHRRSEQAEEQGVSAMKTAEKIYKDIITLPTAERERLFSLIDRGSMRSQRSEPQATGHAAAVLFRLHRPWRRVARLKLRPCAD
jgi:hypothetical protein